MTTGEVDFQVSDSGDELTVRARVKGCPVEVVRTVPKRGLLTTTVGDKLGVEMRNELAMLIAAWDAADQGAIH